ncbi:sensor histidine kinase [Thalassotalea ganghwensis]
MIKTKRELGLGFLTWLLVTIFSMYQWLNHTSPQSNILPATTNTITIAVFLFIGYAFGWLLTHFSQIKSIGFGISAAALAMLMMQFNNGIILILAIIFVSDLSEHIPLKYAVMLGIVIPFTYFPLSLDENVWVNASLFTVFNLFAIFISDRLRQVKKAKEQSAHLVRELKATQQLLAITSKRDERMRIARDLHDVIGHHLTALSLQLEVAQQLSPAPANTHIIRAQSITRLLLSDVREAVSELRTEKVLDIKAALAALTADIDGITINLHISNQLTINDARVAEAIFRAIQEALTNILKHSNASTCEIRLERVNDIINLKVHDNGAPTKEIKLGNGLQGMHERVHHLDGQVRITTNSSGCCLTITLPDPQEYL